MSSEPSEVPDQFRGDEVAARTAWAPLLPKDGANYRTRFVNRASDDRLTFDPSRTSKLIVWFVFIFGIVCLVLGIAITLFWLTGAAANRDPEGDITILKFVGPGFLVGALFFIGVGFFLRNKLLRFIAFDRTLGRYWQGSRTPSPSSNADKKAIELSDIHALQVLEKWVKQTGPDTGGYTSFELNVVTTAGQRQNVIDHSELDGLREDAKTLADFLQVPLWDTTSE